MKLNFCCGGNILDGFENHDADLDITKPLPFNDNTVDFILIEHGLEHVGSCEGFKFMREAYRILKPGGTIRICVPVLDNIVNRDHMTSLILGHGHKMVYSLNTLRSMLYASGFFPHQIEQSKRKPCDGHWKVIGKEKDDLETLRIEATK